MIRFVLGMVPPTLMGLAFWQYVDTSRQAADSAYWVDHTIAARRQATLIARYAGCDPDPEALSRTIDAFSVTTGDNPAQVRAARAIREAVERGDLRAVAPLADAAADEESRLLGERTAADRKRRSRSQSVIAAAFSLGFLMSAALGLLAMTGRLLRRLLGESRGGP